MSRSWTWPALVPALVLAALAATLPLAFAQGSARVEVRDARDARAPLDLREVDSTLEEGVLRFTFITWSRWRSHALRDRAYLLIDLDPQSGRRYRLLVRSKGRRLGGVLYLKRGGRDRPVRRLRVWRRDRYSASVRVAARSVGLPIPGQYAWRAQSLVTREGCPRVCFDRAPDQGDALVAVPAPAAPPAG